MFLNVILWESLIAVVTGKSLYKILNLLIKGMLSYVLSSTFVEQNKNCILTEKVVAKHFKSFIHQDCVSETS